MKIFSVIVQEILMFFTVGIIILGLVGCQSKNTNPNNAFGATESVGHDLSQVENEILDTTQKNEIVSIFSDFASDRARWGEYVKYMSFSELLVKLESISQENAYAKEFVDNAKEIQYIDLNEKSQLIFDVYIKLLFAENSYSAEVSSNLLGAVSEGWFGEYAEGDVTDYFVRFENYPKGEIVSQGRKQYVYVKYINADRSIKCDENHWLTDLENVENRALYSRFSGEMIFEVEDIGVESLNKFLVDNQEFVEYLVDFRDNTYAPIRNKELEEKKKLKEKDKELSESIPRIGMTQAEVKKSKWGEPDKINKDTYSQKIIEQWVYNNKGYVYFENGVVTSVSER